MNTKNGLIVTTRPSVYDIRRASEEFKMIACFIKSPLYKSDIELEQWIKGFLYGCSIYPDPKVIINVADDYIEPIVDRYITIFNEFGWKRNLGATSIVGFNKIYPKGDGDISINIIKYSYADDEDKYINSVFGKKNDN